jgi:ABC-2 type transport system permease protein
MAAEPRYEKYGRLLRLQLRMSLLTSMQYRWDFLGQGVMQVLWLSLSLVPLYIAYNARATSQGGALADTSIGGWGFYPAAMVFGFFYLLKSALDGAINPSLIGVVDHIRKGTLDFVLLKPADAQFLLSTAKFELWHILDGLASLVLIAGAAYKYNHGGEVSPAAFTLFAVVTALLLLICGALLLYGVWLLVVCAAFYVVRIDNLSYLFTSLFDFARWPRGVFRGALHVLFTYVLPLLVMTSFPVDALLGRLRPLDAGWAVVSTGGLLLVSRRVFRRALRSYTSASS